MAVLMGCCSAVSSAPMTAEQRALPMAVLTGCCSAASSAPMTADHWAERKVAQMADLKVDHWAERATTTKQLASDHIGRKFLKYTEHSGRKWERRESRSVIDR
ncbi:hypothetical protein B484DRAFT_404560 [Ochromonadaceae sp. CCMP2298]|nr:hypothetical protein B484DRAFT_404560 [Ochromonadaceae sp. CCMP2298]